MKLPTFLVGLWLLLGTPASAAVRRVILFKFDGVNVELLNQWMAARDPATGRSQLPWMNEIFVHGGARLTNFYTRGISLSAPSWSELDTGRHEVIRGNVEYDRWTLHPYDYLNFFPFYLNYSKKTEVDMPGAELLDSTGIPLLLDAFRPPERWQSYQLYQRGNNWGILQKSVPNHFGGRTPQQLFDEYETGLELESSVAQETERQLIAALADDQVAYLDFFSGDYDHIAHLTNDPASQLRALQGMDAAVGRIYTAARASKLGAQTLFVVVSDHGMNTRPDVLSQGYSFVHWFGSAAGGGHHTITDRHPLSTFKIRGLDPFVHRVTTPGVDATYLKGEADHYPTVLLDLDGNERAGVQLRSSEWNAVQILLQQANRGDLAAPLKTAARAELRRWAEARGTQWAAERSELDRNLDLLENAYSRLTGQVGIDKSEAKAAGIETAHDLELRRLTVFAAGLREQQREYIEFRKAMDSFLAMPADAKPDRVPKQSLGDRNTLYDLQNYVVALAPGGLMLDGGGRIDMSRSFRRINYFHTLPDIRVRNQVQKTVGNRPVDFVAVGLDPAAARQAFGETELTTAIWLRGLTQKEAVILYREHPGGAQDIRYVPVAHLQATREGEIHFDPQPLAAGLPLALCEDPDLELPPGERREDWLLAWHDEPTWFNAIARTRYTNGLIGLSELFRPLQVFPPVWSDSLPPADRERLQRFALFRRALVQPDFEIFAADGWNFNVRNFNPGGNHGGFFPASTHSVLMFSGAGVAPGSAITRPYDSLALTPTVLRLLNRTLPGPPLAGVPIEELVRTAP